LLQPALGSTSTPPPVVPVALVPPVPLPLVPFVDVVAPPAPPVVTVLVLVTWPVVPPVVPCVEPPTVEEDEVALLVTDIPPRVPLVFEALALEPTVLDPVPLVSDVFEVTSGADGGPSPPSELQPTFQPTRVKSAAPTTRRGASAR